jgi:hypothetical protein
MRGLLSSFLFLFDRKACHLLRAWQHAQGGRAFWKTRLKPKTKVYLNSVGIVLRGLAKGKKGPLN